jgi:hypothetical protein
VKVGSPVEVRYRTEANHRVATVVAAEHKPIKPGLQLRRRIQRIVLDNYGDEPQERTCGIQMAASSARGTIFATGADNCA